MSRIDAAIILEGLGYKSDVDYDCVTISPTETVITWKAQTAKPTDAELDAAAPSILAAKAVADAEYVTWLTDKSDLKTTLNNQIDKMNVLIDKVSFTNAERDAAIKDLAQATKKVLKAVKGML